MQFPDQRHFSAWAANCQKLDPGLWLNFQPPWPLSQTLWWRNAIFICILNRSVESVLQNGGVQVDIHFPMVEIPFSIFLRPNPRALINSVSVYHCNTNVHLSAKFCDLKPTIDEMRRPQIWTFIWARCRKRIPRGNCYFISTECFINVNQSWCSTDRLAENSKPRVMLRDQREDQPNWEKLDFSSDSARILAFFGQRHTMWS